MALLLKIVLGLVSLGCVFFGRLVIREYYLFNNNIEQKTTSLGGRILVNGIILILLLFLLFVLLFNILMIASNISIDTWTFI
jgi:hypothetical protein